jgi:fatty-acyl-CoA synthase
VTAAAVSSATVPTVGHALALRALEAPDRVAVDFPDQGRSLSFAQWHAAATDLARGLLDLGLAPGDRVGLLAENRVEWPVVHVALARAGLVCVPLNTHSRRPELAYALEQAGTRALVLSVAFRSHAFLEMVRDARAELPDLGHVVVLDGSAGRLREDEVAYETVLADGGGSRSELPRVGADDAAAIMYTSGTTGRPKGAVLRHGGVIHNGTAVFERLGVTGDDVVTSIVPMFHSASFCTTVPGCLATGASYVGLNAFDAVEMMRLVEQHRATVHVGVPTTFRAMLDHPRRAEFDISSLRVGTCGGADSDPALLQACAESYPMPGLVQVYGLSEASALVTCPLPDDPDRFWSAGAPLPEYEVRIADLATGAAVAVGTPGEVQVRSPHLMTEYFRMPEATREAFTEDGWLRTGDLGTQDVHGRLALTGGRMKDMIIRGGENIYPAEVENVLTQHPLVQQAAVFGLPDERLGEVVAAAVVGGPGLDPEELSAFCAESLARFKVPVVWFGPSELPLTASGKVRKTELRMQGATGQLPGLDAGDASVR